MKDKNNIEIKTGDVVEITGAYFKSDNGLYFVNASPNDPTWRGSDHCLTRIKRNGELSAAKNSTCFWPICSFVNSREKSIASREWNAEHATIEVKTIKSTAAIADYFQEQADKMDFYIRRSYWDFGEDSDHYKRACKEKAFYLGVADRVREP